jgi:hypothetical protein
MNCETEINTDASLGGAFEQSLFRAGSIRTS